MATPRTYAGIAGDERQADRRRRLIEAGFDLLADGGPGAITVTGVCKRARLTARYFYEHFANRDELLDALADAEADRVIDVGLAATMASAPDPYARARAGIAALLDALDADPRAVRVSREQGTSDVVLRMRLAITARLTAAFVEHALLLWPQAQRHPERVALAGQLAVTGVLQLVTGWLNDDAGLSRDELVDVGARFALATGGAVFR